MIFSNTNLPQLMVIRSRFEGKEDRLLNLTSARPSTLGFDSYLTCSKKVDVNHPPYQEA